MGLHGFLYKAFVDVVSGFVGLKDVLGAQTGSCKIFHRKAVSGLYMTFPVSRLGVFGFSGLGQLSFALSL